TNGGVHPKQVRDEPSPGFVVALFEKAPRVVTTCPGHAKVHVGRLSHSLVTAQVCHIAEVAAFRRMEHIVRVAAKHLTGALEKDPGVGYQARNREAGVINSIVTTDEVVRDE